MLTRPSNLYPITPYFNSKTGVERGWQQLSYFALKHKFCGLEATHWGAPTVYILSKSKNDLIFHLKMITKTKSEFNHVQVLQTCKFH